MSSWSHMDSMQIVSPTPCGPQSVRHTEEDDVHALALEFLVALFTVGDIAIVGVVNDDLTTLVGVIVEDLIFEFGLDPPPERVSRFCSSFHYMP